MRLLACVMSLCCAYSCLSFSFFRRSDEILLRSLRQDEHAEVSGRFSGLLSFLMFSYRSTVLGQAPSFSSLEKHVDTWRCHALSYLVGPCQLPRLKSWKFHVPAFPRHVLKNLFVSGPPAKTCFWELGLPWVSGGGFLNTSDLLLLGFALPC